MIKIIDKIEAFGNKHAGIIIWLLVVTFMLQFITWSWIIAGMHP